MKKIDQLMKEMGFNPQASQASKEAFLKHLMKAAEGVQVVTPSEKKEIEAAGLAKIRFHQSVNETQKESLEQQLQFSFLDDDREVS